MRKYVREGNDVELLWSISFDFKECADGSMMRGGGDPHTRKRIVMREGYARERTWFSQNGERNVLIFRYV